MISTELSCRNSFARILGIGLKSFFIFRLSVVVVVEEVVGKLSLKAAGQKKSLTRALAYKVSYLILNKKIPHNIYECRV